MYCTAPHNSLTIQPDGNLSICCAAERTWSFNHISKVDNITELWESHSDLESLRQDKEPLVSKVCGYCLNNAKNGMKNSWFHANVEGESRRASIPTDKTIRFLEFTTSNLCNQTCVTCSSYYSSKWIGLEKEATEMSLDLESWKNPGEPGFNDFGASLYRMSESDIEKILPILPNLEQIVVKGGEPFADNNNYHILEELVKVNDKCLIDMTTNMSKVPQRYIDLLSKASNPVKISVSMDGVGKTYEWVRSTPFEQTIENIERWRSSGITGWVNINHRLNIFNMWNYNEVLEYWNKRVNDTQISFTQMGWVHEPKYAAPQSILTFGELEDWRDNYKKWPENLRRHMHIKNEDYVNNGTIIPTIENYNNWRGRMHMFASFMNLKRNINIYELHPQLKEL